MSRLERLVPAALDEAQRALYAAIAGGRRAQGPQLFRLREDDGSLTGPFNALLHAPGLGQPVQALGEALRFAGVLPDAVREAVILAVARAWSSDFEWYAHAPLARRAGLPPSVIEDLRAGRRPEAADPAVGDALSLAARLLRREDVPDDEYARLRERFTEAGLMELCVLVGYYQLLAGVLRTFAIGCPEGEPSPFAGD